MDVYLVVFAIEEGGAGLRFDYRTLLHPRWALDSSGVYALDIAGAKHSLPDEQTAVKTHKMFHATWLAQVMCVHVRLERL